MNTLPPPVVVRLFPHDGKAAGVVRPHVGRLAQPADLSGIEDLDREATADRMRDLSGQIRAFEAERAALAAHWAELHTPGPDAEETGGKDVVTGERFLPVGPEGMLVSEFASTTLGALIGVGSWAAGSLISDSLDLRHRHPRLESLVVAGKVPLWQARQVAAATTRAGLNDEDARVVDEATASDFARLPFDRAKKALEAELLRAPSSTLGAQRREAQEKQFARAYRSNDAGMKTYVAQLSAADIARFDAMVTHLADVMRSMGDTRPVDVRRAVAFLLLADPASACLMLAGYAAPDSGLDAAPDDTDDENESDTTFVASDASHLDDTTPEADVPGEPGAYGSWEFREDRAWPFTFERQLDLHCSEADTAEDSVFAIRAAQAVGEAIHALGTRLGHRFWDRLRPRAVLHLHGWHDPDAEGGVGEVVRADGVDGPLLADTVREWLGHDRVTVRPVVDLRDHLSADAYEAPSAIREAVRLRHPFEQFPHGRQASPTCDLDHVRAYDPQGPPGQTSTDNLQPLGRRHHRTKTHSRWQVHRTGQGTMWRAPTGHWFLVDHLGTHDLGRPVGRSA